MVVTPADAGKKHALPVPRRWRRGSLGLLLGLAAAHLLVDAVAAFVQPLWPSLKQRLSLSDDTINMAFMCWSLATSIPQILFALLGQRSAWSGLVWAGPAIAAVCIGCVGWADSAWSLFFLLFVGGLGIAAFHPEAAVLAGDCAPENRGRAIAIFAAGGFMGLTVGPMISGAVTTKADMNMLVWTIPVLVPLLSSLAFWLPRNEPVPLPAGQVCIDRIALPSGQRRLLGLLLVLGTLRVVPLTGIPLAVAYVYHQRGATNLDIGLVQSCFQGGIGLGVLGCAAFLTRRHENAALWLLPLVTIPVQLLFPMLSGPVLLAASVASGLALGATQPVLIGYGQRLLPGEQRLASSITMGATWGLGGALVAGILALVNRLDRPADAFAIFALSTLLSCLLCFWLPREPGH